MDEMFTTESVIVSYTANEYFRIAMTAAEAGHTRAFNLLWGFAESVIRATGNRDVRYALSVHPATAKLIAKFGG